MKLKFDIEGIITLIYPVFNGCAWIPKGDADDEGECVPEWAPTIMETMSNINEVNEIKCASRGWYYEVSGLTEAQLKRNIKIANAKFKKLCEKKQKEFLKKHHLSLF